MADLTPILHAFETKIAQSLSSGTSRAKAVQQIVEQQLMALLKKDGSLPYREIYYQGSAYEKLMVYGPEFDLAVLIDMGECVVTKTSNPLQTKLTFTTYKTTKQNLLNTFHLSLKQALREINKSGKKERFYLANNENSPAFEVNVYHDDPQMGGKLWYTFDLVPTLAVRPKGEFREVRYFARQSDEDELWTIDTAADEKEALKNIDRDGGCRKQSIRILKALRDYSPELNAIPSFVFKTLLLAENKKSGLDWRQSALGDRVRGLLQSLQDALQRGQLYEVYNPTVNVMSRIKSPYRENVERRINSLLNQGDRKSVV